MEKNHLSIAEILIKISTREPHHIALVTDNHGHLVPGKIPATE